MRTFIHQDHNGVWRWEAANASPGQTPVETDFTNVTAWRWFSSDKDTRYYNSDGKTPINATTCYDEATGNKGQPIKWDPTLPNCKTTKHANYDSAVWSETEWTLSPSFKPGSYTFRWIWYGAANTNGKRVYGAEPSLFANCVDVVVLDPADPDCSTHHL